MNDDDSQLTETPEISAREHIEQLVDDVRVLASTEIDYYRSRLFYSAGVAKWSGLFAVLALASLLGAMMAIILGLLMALAKVIGFLLATLVIALAFLGAAGGFAWLSRERIRSLRFPEITGEDDT